MKEWLLKTEDGKYHYHRDDMDFHPHYVEKIEIPEGANFATGKGEVVFRKDGYYWRVEVGCDPYWMVTSVTLDNINRQSNLELAWVRQEIFIDESEIINGEISIKGDLAVEGTLAERQKSYGCFEDVATVTEEIIKALKIGNYENMPKPHKMAMYMIASKMARAVNGDYNYKDNWHDIGGYAKLIENLIDGD